MITGWGSTQDVGPAKEKLKEIPLPLTSQKICAEQWGSKQKKSVPYRVIIFYVGTEYNIDSEYFNDGWMCTDPGYLEDACKGDSGGPAVHYDSFRTEFNKNPQATAVLKMWQVSHIFAALKIL